MSDRIVIDPAIQHGKPVIRGTRVPIVRILGGLAGGMSIEEISHEYGVTEADVRAALTYASEVIDQSCSLDEVQRNPGGTFKSPGFHFVSSRLRYFRRKLGFAQLKPTPDTNGESEVYHWLPC
jgi:uncharacterized protein (DUF433 family)